MMIFGIVPGPSMPLWKALLVFSVAIAIAFVFPRSRNKAQEAILFCVYALALWAILWFAQYL